MQSVGATGYLWNFYHVCVAQKSNVELLRKWKSSTTHHIFSFFCFIYYSYLSLSFRKQKSNAMHNTMWPFRICNWCRTQTKILNPDELSKLYSMNSVINKPTQIHSRICLDIGIGGGGDTSHQVSVAQANTRSVTFLTTSPYIQQGTNKSNFLFDLSKKDGWSFEFMNVVIRIC